MAYMKTITTKQELFCQKMIELGNAAAAYAEAYPTQATNSTRRTLIRNACALMKQPFVVARLEVLRAHHGQVHAMTVERLTTMLLEAYQLALTLEQPMALIQATVSLGKLYGLMVERGKIEHTGTVTHQHQGLSRTLEILGEFRGEREAQLSPQSLPH